jgi:D-tyrosyl-tRNA(Tyr) deacylase
MSDYGGKRPFCWQGVGWGKRPFFLKPPPPQHAGPRQGNLVAQLRAQGLTVATGRFGANMLVQIHNDGPVTLMLERGKE